MKYIKRKLLKYLISDLLNGGEQRLAEKYLFRLIWEAVEEKYYEDNLYTRYSHLTGVITEVYRTAVNKKD